MWPKLCGESVQFLPHVLRLLCVPRAQPSTLATGQNHPKTMAAGGELLRKF